MSRAAAMQSNKKEQKAAIGAKNDEKDRLAALGMTPAWKKAVGEDTVLCMECGATTMGPTKCECKGGRKKPGADDEPIPHLLAAAKARLASGKAEDLAENARNAGQVAKGRAAHKAAKEDERNDLTTELQGDGGNEIVQIVEFPVGKLGMDIEGNAICKLGDAPSAAADLGVKVGWIIHSINGDNVGAKKSVIVKAAVAAMKLGPVKFGFRVPLVLGYNFCKACDKFQAPDQFEEDQVSQGHGKMLCSGCADFADMGF